MKKRGWVTEDEIGGEHLIEMSKYVCIQRCAEKDCATVIAYNRPGGEDDDEDFRIETCTCDFPALCCTKHVDTHVCPKCSKDKEEEE